MAFQAALNAFERGEIQQGDIVLAARVLIGALPPGRDEAFVGAWERARSSGLTPPAIEALRATLARL